MDNSLEVSVQSNAVDWAEVRQAALTTVGKYDAEEKQPSSEWKRKMLLSEHSPIRDITIKAVFKNIKYWVSVHLVRHKIGIEHFVRTQRSDRTGVKRDELPQGALVEHRISANAQAMITISRKRMCQKASLETRAAWNTLILELSNHEPELASACVPDCIYRGHCYELQSCGFHKTEGYFNWLEKYREGINQ